MSRTSVIRYRTRPDAAEENVRLVEAVYAALAEARPRDFEYATYRLDDGATFVHLSTRPAGAVEPVASALRRVGVRTGSLLDDGCRR